MYRSMLILLLLSLPTALFGLAPGSANREPESAAAAQLIAHWQLGLGDGSTAADSSGNGHDGTISGGAWINEAPVASDNAYSLDFLGNAFVQAPAFAINDDFSVMAWVNPGELNNRAILGKHTDGGANQLLLGFYQGGYHLVLQGDSYTGGDPITGWQQLILTGDANQMGTLVTLYRNGQPLWQHQFKSVAGDMSGGKGWTLGRDWDGQVTNDFFAGRMADVRIYDAALSAGEIAALTAPRLVTHWRLDEGGGSVAGDTSGNGHEGTISGGTWSTDVPPGAGLSHSLRLEGTGYVQTAAFDLDDSFTIAAWAKPESFSNNAVLAKHTGDGSNQFVFGFYRDSYHANLWNEYVDAGLPLTGWAHYTLVGLPHAGGTELTLYRNGVSQWTRTVAAKMGNVRPGRPWIIGMDWDGDNATDHFVGNLADIRLYDRALTREQVAELALAFASTCRVPSAGYPSLASGVGDPACDIVAVGPGAFAVTELAPEHGLILRGSGAGETTLTDGGGDGPLLLLQNNIELEALSITGIDRDVDGPVLQIGAQSRAALAGMAFQNNRGRAGGVIMNLGRLLIRDSLFANNTAASRGGAIFNYGAGAPGPTELHVEDSLFSGNSAVSGGVLYSDAAQDTFIRSDFLDNASSSAGGALYAYFNTLAVRDSVFENNASQGGAGALHIDYGQVTISGSQINKNSASAAGGAIRVTGSDARLEIRGTSFSANSARFSGGAIDATAGRLDIATSTFSGNRAGDLATAAAPASTLSIFDAQARVENSTFSGNQTLPGLIPVQATIRTGGDSDLTLVHSTVADNDPGGEPGIFGLFAFGRSLQVHNTIFARNGSKNCDVRQIEPDEIAFTGSLADDGSCGDAAVSDALFLQPLADNGGLTQTQAITEESAAIGAADPAFCLPHDQRGAARDLAACDVGAYEFVVEQLLRLYLPAIIR